MPITATCTNCGKSYQAPDAMSGKSVRCKDCGTVFKLLAPQDAPEPGDLDFEALERSFSGEAVDTSLGGPAVDAKGKVSIKRAANVEDIGFARDLSSGVRSNFRYRFPMAKEIDQFLPWVLLIACVGLLARWCMTSTEAGVEDAPSTGVALSRFFLLFGAYLLIIFPAAHIAMHKASRKLRFSMPRAAAWRSFTGFMPLLLLGPGLYMLSGGSAAGLIFGILLGTAVSVGSITLLYRLFPNEMPTVGIYTGSGAVIGGAFTVAALFAINLVALHIANLSKKEPDLFVSPIALGLPWQEKPAPKLALAPKTPTKVVETPPEPAPATQETTPTVAPMVRVDVPSEARSAAGQLVKKMERPPVLPGFELINAAPVASRALAVIRNESLETYNTSSWLRVASAGGFLRTDAIVTNTIGDVAMRIIRVPSYRLEPLQLDRGRRPDPILFEGSQERTIIGFVNERVVMLMSNNGFKLSAERYDIARAQRVGSPVPLLEEGGGPGLDVGNTFRCVRLSPDGKYILVVGRAPGGGTAPGRIALYPMSDPANPVNVLSLPLNDKVYMDPVGLAINKDATVAMVLDTANEAYFTVWQMRDRVIDGVTYIAPKKQILDRKIGVLSTLRPIYWEAHHYDALVWLNENTLLLFGTYLLDSTTGKVVDVGIKDVVGQVREDDNVVAIVQRTDGGLRQLLRVTFDANVSELMRK